MSLPKEINNIIATNQYNFTNLDLYDYLQIEIGKELWTLRNKDIESFKTQKQHLIDSCKNHFKALKANAIFQVCIESKDKDPKKNLWNIFQIPKGIITDPSFNLADLASNEEDKKKVVQKAKFELKLKELIPKIKDFYLDNKTNIKVPKKYDFLSYESLMPQQIDAVNLILQNYEYIIGLQAGSGKTYIGAVAIKYICSRYNEKALVVCPNSLKNQWKEALENEEVDRQTDVINYEGFCTMYNFKGTKLELKKVIKNPKVFHISKNEYKIIIFDEVHFVKNVNSKRARAIKQFVTDKNIKHRIGLSGTPISNKVVDLYGSIKVFSKHPIGELNINEFNFMMEQKSGQAIFKNFSKDIVWFRTLADYGITLPDVNIVYIPIEPTQSYINECKQVMLESKEIPLYNGDSASKATQVVNTAIQKLRVLATKNKVGWCMNKIKIDLKDKKSVVFSSFNQGCLKELGRELNCPTYDGSKSTLERDKLKKAYINNEFNTFLANYTVGGTGTDGLQKASQEMILLNPEWTIGMFIQTIARLRRIGSPFKIVNVYIPYIDIDEETCKKDNLINIEPLIINSLRKKAEVFNYFFRNEDSKDVDFEELLEESPEQRVYQEMYLRLGLNKPASFKNAKIEKDNHAIIS